MGFCVSALMLSTRKSCGLRRAVCGTIGIVVGPYSSAEAERTLGKGEVAGSTPATGSSSEAHLPVGLFRWCLGRFEKGRLALAGKTGSI